jgi:glycerol-3-phosphate dehydrogenase
VYQALHERRRLLANAPHLVDIQPFLLPLFAKDGLIPKKLARTLGAAMWAYDATGGWRIGKFHQRIDTAEAIAHMPTLPADKIGGAYIYYDAAADDARLVLTVIRTAALDHGAVAANRVSALGCAKRPAASSTAWKWRPTASTSRSTRTRSHQRRRRVCRRRACARRSGAPPLDHPGQGHPPDRALGPGAQRHRRDPAGEGRPTVVFVVPWGDHTYIGTTDTNYDGPIDDPQCTPADVDVPAGRPERLDRRRTDPRRRHRHLGRAATAGGRTAGPAAPPTCPVSTAC